MHYIQLIFFTLFQVNGNHCFTNRMACGRGTRCVMGHYCIAFGKLRPSRNQDNLHKNTSTETDSKSELICERDCVWIYYKGPILDMLDDAKLDLENDLISLSEARIFFGDIGTQAREDGENCNYEDIKNIGWAAQDIFQYSSFSNSNKDNIIKEIGELKKMYERLDNARCWGHVESTSPLSEFRPGEFIRVDYIIYVRGKCIVLWTLD